jgi:hypothetical protein
MKLLRTLAPVAALAAALVLPASSSAQDPVPPGNSGGGQYLPSVPEGGGKKHEDDVRNDAKPSGERLPAPVVSELESQGSEGVAAAAAAAATTPDSDMLEAAKRRKERRAERRKERRAERRKERRAERQRELRQERRARDSLAAETASAGLPGAGEERLGAAFPIILGAGLIATLGLLAWRRRTGNQLG